MFHDLRSGETALPNQDNVMTLTSILEGQIYHKRLIVVEETAPEPVPAVPVKSAK